MGRPPRPPPDRPPRGPAALPAGRAVGPQPRRRPRPAWVHARGPPAPPAPPAPRGVGDAGPAAPRTGRGGPRAPGGRRRGGRLSHGGGTAPLRGGLPDAVAGPQPAPGLVLAAVRRRRDRRLRVAVLH